MYSPFGDCCDVFVGSNGLYAMLITDFMILLVNAGGFLAITIFLCKDPLLQVLLYISIAVCTLSYLKLCISNPGVPSQIMDKVKGRVSSA